MINIYKGYSPWWCRVKEAVCGEISDRNIGYKSLADGVDIDIVSFTQDDVMNCLDINDLPDDWRRLAERCIEVYNIKP